MEWKNPVIDNIAKNDPLPYGDAVEIGSTSARPKKYGKRIHQRIIDCDKTTAYLAKIIIYLERSSPYPNGMRLVI